MKLVSRLFLFPFFFAQFAPIWGSPAEKSACVRSVFMETIRELGEFSELQLEAFQNISPETKRKTKTAIMDVLSSLGLVLELSTAPSVSLSMLPLYLLRAKNLIVLLERDLENLQTETENLSSSLEPIKKGVMAVVQRMPIKAFNCLQSGEL